MSDSLYYGYRDTELVQVPPIDKLCLALKDKFLRQEEYIETLKAENTKLKADNYKDVELAEMKERYDNMKDDYYRGFPISKEEDEAIIKWYKTHDCKFKNGNKSLGPICGQYTYEFRPTSIGVIGTVTCSCGEKYKFQDLS